MVLHLTLRVAAPGPVPPRTPAVAGVATRGDVMRNMIGADDSEYRYDGGLLDAHSFFIAICFFGSKRMVFAQTESKGA